MISRLLPKTIGAFGLLFCVADNSYADIWLEDPVTNCKVWSGDDGSAKEVVSWSGACDGGKAIGAGTMVAFDTGGTAVVFKGEMTAGKMNGWGSIKFRNEDTNKYDTYIGNFKDSTPSGTGIFDSSEGWRFQGHFQGTFDSGDGILHLSENNAVIRGQFKEGDLIGDAFVYYESENGEMYFGDMANGTRDGFGTLIHANDDTYVGEFENGVASGAGVYEYDSGRMVMGQYENGAPNGAATVIVSNGDAYQGMFIDGLADGLVLVTRADGSQSTETWVKGERQP